MAPVDALTMALANLKEILEKPYASFPVVPHESDPDGIEQRQVKRMTDLNRNIHELQTLIQIPETLPDEALEEGGREPPVVARPVDLERKNLRRSQRAANQPRPNYRDAPTSKKKKEDAARGARVEERGAA